MSVVRVHESVSRSVDLSLRWRYEYIQNGGHSSQLLGRIARQWQATPLRQTDEHNAIADYTSGR